MEEHVPGPRRDDRRQRYAVTMGAFGALGAGLLLVGRGRSVTPPTAVDVAIVGLATQKLSRLVAKQVVTTPIRAPFTEVVGPGGPAEIHERPIGDGWRRTVGELVTCPFCLDVWFAAGLTAGVVLAPTAGRAVAAGLASVGVADGLQLLYDGAQRVAEGS